MPEYSSQQQDPGVTVRTDGDWWASFQNVTKKSLSDWSVKISGVSTTVVLLSRTELKMGIQSEITIGPKTLAVAGGQLLLSGPFQIEAAFGVKLQFIFVALEYLAMRGDFTQYTGQAFRRVNGQTEAQLHVQAYCETQIADYKKWFEKYESLKKLAAKQDELAESVKTRATSVKDSIATLTTDAEAIETKATQYDTGADKWKATSQTQTNIQGAMVTLTSDMQLNGATVKLGDALQALGTQAFAPNPNVKARIAQLKTKLTAGKARLTAGQAKLQTQEATRNVLDQAVQAIQPTP